MPPKNNNNNNNNNNNTNQQPQPQQQGRQPVSVGVGAPNSPHYYHNNNNNSANNNNMPGGGPMHRQQQQHHHHHHHQQFQNQQPPPQQQQPPYSGKSGVVDDGNNNNNNNAAAYYNNNNNNNNGYYDNNGGMSDGMPPPPQGYSQNNRQGPPPPHQQQQQQQQQPMQSAPSSSPANYNNNPNSSHSGMMPPPPQQQQQQQQYPSARSTPAPQQHYGGGKGGGGRGGGNMNNSNNLNKNNNNQQQQQQQYQMQQQQPQSMNNSHNGYPINAGGYNNNNNMMGGAPQESGYPQQQQGRYNNNNNNNDGYNGGGYGYGNNNNAGPDSHSSPPPPPPGQQQQQGSMPPPPLQQQQQHQGSPPHAGGGRGGRGQGQQQQQQQQYHYNNSNNSSPMMDNNPNAYYNSNNNNNTARDGSHPSSPAPNYGGPGGYAPQQQQQPPPSGPGSPMPPPPSHIPPQQQGRYNNNNNYQQQPPPPPPPHAQGATGSYMNSPYPQPQGGPAGGGMMGAPPGQQQQQQQVPPYPPQQPPPPQGGGNVGVQLPMHQQHHQHYHQHQHQQQQQQQPMGASGGGYPGAPIPPPGMHHQHHQQQQQMPPPSGGAQPVTYGHHQHHQHHAYQQPPPPPPGAPHHMLHHQQQPPMMAGGAPPPPGMPYPGGSGPHANNGMLPPGPMQLPPPPVAGGVPPMGAAGGIPPPPLPQQGAPQMMAPNLQPPPQQMTMGAVGIPGADYSGMMPPPAPEPHFCNLLANRQLQHSAVPLRTAFPAIYARAAEGVRDPSRRVRVLVDGNHVVQNELRPELERANPCWFLHSPLPDQLRDLVADLVRRMRAAGMEPVWVFNGIGISGDVEAFLPDSEELQMRQRVWRQLSEGSVPSREEVHDAFDASVAGVSEDVLLALQRFLRVEAGVKAVTAPFLNWSQMVALMLDGDGDALYGSAEAVLLPLAGLRVACSLSFTDPAQPSPDNCVVSYVDRDEVLQALFPGIDAATAGSLLIDFGLVTATHTALTAARVTVQSAATGLPLTEDEVLQELRALPSRPGSTIRDLLQTPLEYTKHAKGRCYLLYSPVFTRREGSSPLRYFRDVCEPRLTPESAPINLTSVFGNMVPNSLYYFLFTGLLSVRFMTIITQRYFSDAFPVAESLTCRNAMSSLIALRTQTVYQIVNLIQTHDGDMYQNAFLALSWIRWFKKILMTVSRPNDTIVLDEWDLSPIAHELEDNNNSKSAGKTTGSAKGKNTAANSVSNAADAETAAVQGTTIQKVLALRPRLRCVPHPDPGQVLYHGKHQTFVAVLLKTFDFLGYFSHQETEGIDPAAVANTSGASGSEGGGAAGAAGGAAAGENGGAMTFVQCLGTLLDETDDMDTDLQAGYVRLTELLRIGVIEPNRWRYIDDGSGAMLEGDDPPPVEDPQEVDEADTTLLISRIACLVHIPYYPGSASGERNNNNNNNANGGAGEDVSAMNGTEQELPFQWAPVYSRHLSAFAVLVRFLNTDLRELAHVILASFFLKRHCDCGISEIAALGDALPFHDVPSTIGALLLHYVLVFPDDYEAGCETPAQRLEHLAAKFNGVAALETSLRTVFTFCFRALYLINAYRHHDPEIFPAPGAAASAVLSTDVIAESLEALRLKWALHFEGPVPHDPHGLWPAADGA